MEDRGMAMMFKIQTTKNSEMYIAPSEVIRIVAREYSGGGSIIWMRDGTRIETYKHIDGVYAAMNAATDE
jgi:hypothetical protein